MLSPDLTDKDLEQIILGQILIDKDAIKAAVRWAKSEHFGIDAHQQIYDSSLSLWRAGTGVDLLTVTMDLRRKGQLDGIGGAYALSHMTSRVSSTCHLEDHCAILRELSSLRRLRATGLSLAGETDLSADPRELMGMVNAQMEGLAIVDDGADLNAADVAYALMDGSEKPKPVYLGIANLDQYVFVLPGNMVTIRGAAGSGKTAFLLTVILNLLDQKKVWFVSLEMPATEVMTRILCQLACVDMDRAMTGQISDVERDRMAEAASSNAGVLENLIIDDSGSMNVDVYRAKGEYMVKHRGVELIVIDYAQLMSGDRKLHKSKVEELEAISGGIRTSARTLNVIVLAVVHVNKEGQDHGTAQFEKDAHVRLHLDRTGNEAKIDILKNRNGRINLVDSPCVMQYGMVGRTQPPHWNAVKVPGQVPTFNPRQGFDAGRVQPEKDDLMPF